MALTPAQRAKRYRDTHPATAKGGGHGARRVTRENAPFYGFDGEGMDDADGRHILYILRAGDEELYDGGRALGGREILQWISRLRHSQYIGFSLNYDFTMILRDIGGLVDGKGRDVLGRIITKKDLTPLEGTFGVAIPGWGVRVSWMPNKHLIVSTMGNPQTITDPGRIAKTLAPLKDSRGRSVLSRLSESSALGESSALTVTERERGILVDGSYYVKWAPGRPLTVTRKSRKIRISDTFGLFQCSFVKACEDWGVGTQDERDAMQLMKDKRGAFTDDETERDYNRKECEFMAALLDKIREACRDAGIRPTNWEGAGKLAEALYRSHSSPRVRRGEDHPNGPQAGDIVIPDEIARIAGAAYYGGRFETSASGVVSRTVYDYDINSAYPHAMRTLPCLREDHGAWHHGARPTEHSVCRVSWHPANDARPGLGPFPVRTKQGGLVFPLNNYPDSPEWYWWSEVSAAIDSGLFHITIEDTWTWVSTCPCPPPFEWVESTYAERLALMAQGETERGMVIKLAINSLYGKTAQTQGRAPYLNKVYAGMITAQCRAMIYRAACTVGHGNVLMIATDGIFTTVPMTIPHTGHKVLGEWDETVMAEGITIVQPGLYRRHDGPLGKQYKTRGVSRNTMAANWHLFEHAFSVSSQFYAIMPVPGALPRTPVEITLFNIFRGLRLAWWRGKLDQAGRWDVDVPQNYYLMPGKKRDVDRGQAGTRPDGSVDWRYWTYPPLDSAGGPSHLVIRLKTPEQANLGEADSNVGELGDEW